MQRVSLFSGGGPRRVLVLRAHCDDIEIGCGGTLLRLASERPMSRCAGCLQLHARSRREARASAAAFLQGVARSQVIVRDHRDGYLPHSGAVVKDEFEALKREYSPT